MSVYQIAKDKYYETEEKRQKDLNTTLKTLISSLRTACKTNEYNPITTGMGYLFEHIKKHSIILFSSFVNHNTSIELSKLKFDDIKWNKFLFNELSQFKIPDFMYWIFIYVPYYDKYNLNKKREIYEQMLDYMLENWNENLYLKNEEYMFMTKTTYMTYPLSYHNKNNCNILKKVCKLNRKICPSLNYINPNNNKLKLEYKQSITQLNTNNIDNNKVKVKICFISDSLMKDSSVLRDRMGIILALLRDNRFDVYIAGTVDFNNNSPISYSFSQLFNKIKGINGIIKLKDNLDLARKQIINKNFHIIIYPDIGMKTFQTFLAYSKLAPIQINTWGHSDTSGIDTIDYYISSKYYELDKEEAQTHYNEKLILMDSLSTYYYEPIQMFCGDNFEFKKRGDIGLPFKNTDNIYWCMQSCFKLTDEFEKLIGQIIKKDSNSIILLSSGIPMCTSQIMRIKKNLGVDDKPELEKRIKIYPALNKNNFYNFIKISDILIDPYPFGGCNTTLEGFNFDKPVITMPSDYINGRFTLGFYNKMIDDSINNENVKPKYLQNMIVTNFDDYLKLALKLTSDKEYYNNVSNEIKQYKKYLFKDKKSINEWKNVLLNL